MRRNSLAWQTHSFSHWTNLLLKRFRHHFPDGCVFVASLRVCFFWDFSAHYFIAAEPATDSLAATEFLNFILILHLLGLLLVRLHWRIHLKTSFLPDAAAAAAPHEDPLEDDSEADDPPVTDTSAIDAIKNDLLSASTSLRTQQSHRTWTRKWEQMGFPPIDDQLTRQQFLTRLEKSV